MLRLLTFGTPALLDGDRALPSSRKLLFLLTYLARQSARRADADYMAQLLWPGKGIERARASLRTELYKWRDYNLVDRDGVDLRLHDDGLQVDLWEFDGAEAEDRYADAVRAYQGPFLGSDPLGDLPEFGSWVEGERIRWDGRSIEAATRAAAALVDAEQADEAVALIRRTAEIHTHSDSVMLALMRSLDAAGDRGAALAEFKRHATLLRDDDDEPGDRLRRFAEALQQSLDAEPIPTPVQKAKFGSAPSSARAIKTSWPRPARHRRRMIATAGLAVVALAAFIEAVRTPDAILIKAAITHPELGSRWGWLELARGGATFHLATSSERPFVRSPDGQFEVYSVNEPEGGTDLWGRTPAGESFPVATGRHDERLGGFTAGGRFLVMIRGILDEETGAYRRDVALWDAEDHSLRPLEVPAPWYNIGTVAPSPGGQRVAVSHIREGKGVLSVFGLGGRLVEEFVLEGGFARSLSWSPDLERIAFTLSGGGRRISDTYVLERTTGDVRALAEGPNMDDYTVWLSSVHVATLSRGPKQHFLAVADVRPGGRRFYYRMPDNVRWIGPPSERLAPEEAERILEVIAEEVVNGAPPIDSLSVSAAVDTIATGEVLDLKLDAWAPGGIPYPLQERIRWRTSDSGVLDVDQWGRAVGMEPGSGTVEAYLPGHSAKSHEIHVLDTRSDSAPPSLQESWDPAWTDRWHRWGVPLPTVVSDERAVGRASLSPNGDQNHLSGVTSRRWFSLERGLTVEAIVETDFRGTLFEGTRIALATSEIDSIGRSIHRDHRWWVGQVSLVGESNALVLESPAGAVQLDPPAPSGRFLLGLQVTPEGSVHLLVEGRIRARLPSPVSGFRHDSTRVLLMGQPAGRAFIGEVRVTEGLRIVPAVGSGGARPVTEAR